MRLIQTAILFDQGQIVDTPGWRTTYEAYAAAIKKMVNPPGTDHFVLRKKTRKLDKNGKETKQWNRNGVAPIKTQFHRLMAERGWRPEAPLDLSPYFQSKQILPYRLYPGPEAQDITEDFSVGDFDFWFRTADGIRTAIEWETGNISSSHRSVNKLCIALAASLIDAAVLIVPSRKTYPHLTDRIGNWDELRPYIAFWQRHGRTIERGLLAMSVWEHDKLVADESVPYIVQGIDGRSAEGLAKI